MRAVIVLTSALSTAIAVVLLWLGLPDSLSHVPARGEPASASADPFDELLALQSAAYAQGGVEIGSAGFHPFVADPMYDARAWLVPFRRHVDGSVNEGGHTVHVNLKRDTVLQALVEEIEVVPSPGLPVGAYDVVVRFQPGAEAHCFERQAARENAEASSMMREDLGVSLVHENLIFGYWTYGDLGHAIAQGPVTVCRGADLAVSQAIESGLSP